MVLIDKFTNPYWYCNHVKVVQKVKQRPEGRFETFMRHEDRMKPFCCLPDSPIYNISHVENEGNDYYCAIIMVRFHNSISIKASIFWWNPAGVNKLKLTRHLAFIPVDFQ